MRSLLLLTLVCGCAYGISPEQEITYGHSKGGTNTDGGSDNLGSDNSSSDGLGQGCRWEAVVENGQPTNYYVLCPQFEFSWKNTPDPPPDQKQQ